MSKRIVIAGGGLAGVETALRLNQKIKDKTSITLIEENQFVIHPELLTSLFRKDSKYDPLVNLEFLLGNKGIKFVNAKVTGLNENEKFVKTSKGNEQFDFLVLALGTQPDYSVPGSDKNTMRCKTGEDIERIKKSTSHLLSKSLKHDIKDKAFNIAVCGGGPAGVELCSELNEFLNHCCEDSGVRRIDVKLILIEEKNSLLPSLSKKAGFEAANYLSRHGVDMRLNSKIDEISHGFINFADNSKLRADIIIWCGGVKPNELIEKTDLSRNEEGKIIVNPYTQSTSDAMVYAVGDIATFKSPDYKGAQTTSTDNIIKQTEILAHNLSVVLSGEGEMKYFSYEKPPMWISLGNDKVLMAGRENVSQGKHIDLLYKFRKKRFYKRWR